MTAPPETPCADAKPRKIAVVDDDPDVRGSFEFLLEVAGYTVVTFASAAEFLEHDIHQLACLILDHHMPHMTGLELAIRLRADGVEIPIMLMTGSPSANLSARASALGIHRVLDKPVDAQDLLDFIDAALA